MQNNHTIAAVATGEGGAIAVIRVSGPDAITICDPLFHNANGRKLLNQKGFSLLYGTLVAPGGAVVDEVLVSVFRAPNSYTGENMIEISCHASPYIEQEILRLLINAGARSAEPGEFTQRAFLNGKMDLSQAEAVADLIASGNRAAHDLAMSQMRGGYSDEFRRLRGQLIDLAALLELELDFGEEEVEFADRRQIQELMEQLAEKIGVLRDSYTWGNVIKHGIPVAIVGAPNVGKSTLLNALLNEDRAMVSDIPGTTRDAIEDTLNIRGIPYRFIDTAGIRHTDDALEAMGIERTFRHLENAAVVLLVTDTTASSDGILAQCQGIGRQSRQHAAVVLNKIDREDSWKSLAETLEKETGWPVIPISAKLGKNIEQLTDFLLSVTASAPRLEQVVVTNARHYEALNSACAAIDRAKTALESGLSGDLLAEDLRSVIHHIGSITSEGMITSEDVLHTIFSRFCIGK